MIASIIRKVVMEKTNGNDRSANCSAKGTSSKEGQNNGTSAWEKAEPPPRLHKYSRYIVDPVKNPGLERTLPKYVLDKETQKEMLKKMF